jgi:hypothetical protein
MVLEFRPVDHIIFIRIHVWKMGVEALGIGHFLVMIRRLRCTARQQADR